MFHFLFTKSDESLPAVQIGQWSPASSSLCLFNDKDIQLKYIKDNVFLCVNFQYTKNQVYLDDKPVTPGSIIGMTNRSLVRLRQNNSYDSLMYFYQRVEMKDEDLYSKQQVITFMQHALDFFELAERARNSLYVNALPLQPPPPPPPPYSSSPNSIQAPPANSPSPRPPPSPLSHNSQEFPALEVYDNNADLLQQFSLLSQLGSSPSTLALNSYNNNNDFLEDDSAKEDGFGIDYSSLFSSTMRSSWQSSPSPHKVQPMQEEEEQEEQEEIMAYGIQLRKRKRESSSSSSSSTSSSSRKKTSKPYHLSETLLQDLNIDQFVCIVEKLATCQDRNDLNNEFTTTPDMYPIMDTIFTLFGESSKETLTNRMQNTTVKATIHQARSVLLGHLKISRLEFILQTRTQHRRSMPSKTVNNH